MTMTLMATLIAIAAWCGQPVVMTERNDILAPSYMTADAVDQCRKEVWECLQKTPHNAQCFLGQKTRPR